MPFEPPQGKIKKKKDKKAKLMYEPWWWDFFLLCEVPSQLKLQRTGAEKQLWTQSAESWRAGCCGEAITEGKILRWMYVYILHVWVGGRRGRKSKAFPGLDQGGGQAQPRFLPGQGLLYSAVGLP